MVIVDDPIVLSFDSHLSFLSYISSASALRQEPYVLETTVSGFSKKPIVSMKLQESCFCLSLSESIAFHKLPNLETVAVITKAKGANAYSWDDLVSCLPVCLGALSCVLSACLHIGLELCFVSLSSTHWIERGRGFVEVRDFGVPDTAKSISWCGDNICLGIRKEYVILNTANGTLSEVFPSSRVSPPLVRLLRSPYPLIQTVVLQIIRHLDKSNSAVIVDLDNSAHVLFPVSIGAQIVQLTASGNFEEALALCKLLPPEDSSLRAAKESSIHTRFAHYFFENGSYEEAMEHFLASQVDITHMVDEASLYRGSSGISDDMESSSPRYYLESEGNAALESKKMSHNTLMALIKPGIIEKATSEGTEEVISDAVGKSMKSNKGRGVILPLNSGAREMAAILDTALLQALLHTGQSGAAVDLLKGVNYCDVNICEEILMKSKIYSALLELFKSNSMHHEALKLLKQLLEDSKSNQLSTYFNTHLHHLIASFFLFLNIMKECCAFLLLLLFICPLGFYLYTIEYGTKLSPDFYAHSCPQVEDIVIDVLATTIATETRMAASLMRLHYHDCFLLDLMRKGCDGSLLLDSIGGIVSEKNSVFNSQSVRGFEVIDQIKAQLEKECPGTVSCADVLTLAARDSSVLSGGPSWVVPLGRRDSINASLSGSNSNIPASNDSFKAILRKFNRHGLDVTDLVALSGSHTIGFSRCTSFRQRLYNQSGDGRPDITLEESFAANLRKSCPIAGGEENLSVLDMVTAAKFDNNYFINLIKNMGLLYSDQILFSGNDISRGLVITYAQDQEVFFLQFAESMIKMGNISPLMGSNGEIRKNCRKINS
ncbi:LOW QUALITY PROTEIN: hypothetical protein HID58_030174 [Brassica napus]|uniref:peroxidase n=1 Tax=Brassica napus TaxID=3708 RepID=A0ABQ8CGS1_BRANA|nr:LOW QUALITY PROTEIN: hypothetical protein HID58_030174 [Brassica napus]